MEEENQNNNQIKQESNNTEYHTEPLSLDEIQEVLAEIRY